MKRALIYMAFIVACCVSEPLYADVSANADCGGIRGYANLCAADGKLLPSQSRLPPPAPYICPIGATCAGKTDSTTSTATATGTGTFYGTSAQPVSSTITGTNTAVSPILSVLYSLDLTTITSITTGTSTVTTTNLLTGGDGIKMLAGKPWTLVNSTNLATAAVNDGTHSGLYMRHNTNNTNDYGSSIVAPRLGAQISDLYGAPVSPTTFTDLWAWCMYTTPHTPGENYEAASFMLTESYLNNSTRMFWVELARMYLNQLIENPKWGYNGAQTDVITSAAPTTVDVVVLRMSLNRGGWEWYVGNSQNNEFPARTSLNLISFRYVVSGTQTPMVGYDTTNPTGSLDIAFRVQTGNGSGLADGLFKKIKLEGRRLE